MSSAGRRTSFRPGRSSITGRVRAAVMTATAWSRVSDLDGRPSWPLGVSARAATLRVTRSLASACRMARLSARCPMRHRRGGVPGGHLGQRLPDVGRGQLAELAGADDFQDRRQDVLVLGDGLGRAAVQPVGEPVLGGLPDGVVDVAGLGGDALVELGVQVAELVDDGGLGLAADLAPVALAVAGVAEGDLAAPQAGAVPVAVRVAAGAAVFEGDAVFAAPAPGRHALRLPWWGLSW